MALPLVRRYYEVLYGYHTLPTLTGWWQASAWHARLQEAISPNGSQRPHGRGCRECSHSVQCSRTVLGLAIPCLLGWLFWRAFEDMPARAVKSSRSVQWRGGWRSPVQSGKGHHVRKKAWIKTRAAPMTVRKNPSHIR